MPVLRRPSEPARQTRQVELVLSSPRLARTKTLEFFDVLGCFRGTSCCYLTSSDSWSGARCFLLNAFDNRRVFFKGGKVEVNVIGELFPPEHANREAGSAKFLST
jgi:hypothetical protein